VSLQKDIVILQGKTFQHVLRWETLPFVYKPITGITQGAPARITAIGHGLSTGWRAAVVSVKGMSQINATDSAKLREKDFHTVNVIDVDHVEMNDVNSAEFKAYVSGGYLQYYTPVDLSGYTARMSIKDKVGGTELLRLDNTNSRLNIDTASHTVSMFIDATTTAAIVFKNGVYDLEMVSGTGVVTLLMSGSISVTTEVTTT